MKSRAAGHLEENCPKCGDWRSSFSYSKIAHAAHTNKKQILRFAKDDKWKDDKWKDEKWKDDK